VTRTKPSRASYWIDLGERTIRSFAQSLVATLGVGAALSPVTHLPWLVALEIGASSAVMSVLTSLAAMKVGDPQTASFLPPPKKTEAAVKSLLGK
jgi:Putative lactococcus lactis phage r1t holin